jgi:signal peptidase I
MTSANRMKRWLARNWREWRSFPIFFGLMAVFRSAVADWMVVPSGSMNPTLMEGDRIFVQKMHYGLRLPFTALRLTAGDIPQRGDIVVFRSPANGKTLVKRLIGLPGDSVELRAERLFINGVAADYAPAGWSRDDELVAEFRGADHAVMSERIGGSQHDIMLLPARPALRNFGPVRVPEDSYLMLGDNRDDSADSRFIGPVPRANLLGRATRVVISLNPERHLLPRAERTFAPLD